MGTPKTQRAESESRPSSRQIACLTLLDEYDLKALSLSDDKRIRWFSEAVRVVKISILDGFKAKLEIDRICVYNRLRMHHSDPSSRRIRTEEIRGVVVPRQQTLYFSRAGKSHPKVLYEETAHSLVHPVSDRRDPQIVCLERYKCHLEIFEGLQGSECFGRMEPAEQRALKGLIRKLGSRCVVRGRTSLTPCRCTNVRGDSV